jgi:hypothetical protein
MDFVKKHYEKILLGVVLLGLAAVVFFLFSWISSEQEKLRERTTTTVVGTGTALPPLKEDELLHGLNPAPKLDFSMTNRLFNPVKWQKSPAGKLIKISRGDEVGPGALIVTNISPLYLTITLDSIIPHDTGASYGIGIQDESAESPAMRRKRTVYISLNGKNPTFALTEVKGTADAPELSLVLADTGKTAVVSKDKPFQRVDGHIADIKYDPEKSVFHKYRVGNSFTIEGQRYKIVVISDSEVVVSAESNDKKTTITYTPKP